MIFSRYFTQNMSVIFYNYFNYSFYHTQFIYIYQMFLVNWVYNAITSTLLSLGLKNKKAKIVFLGLDDAGKSTLMNMLKFGTMKQLDPTCQPHSEELILGNITFKAWDLGGHQAARKTWRNYTCDIDGIVYLVDSSNPKRFQESRCELNGLLQMTALQNIPIVVLGNKLDKHGAVSVDQLRSQLGLQDYISSNTSGSKQSRPIQLFMCSIPKKVGYSQGFKWLSKYLK